jgi:trimeric autotransporter adhesin
MNYTPLIFTVFSLLASMLLFAIWSNIYVYAQQSSSPTLSASSPSAGSSPITTISSQLKAKMCDPSNPSLKAVNTTESHICGIPKTVKPPSLPGAAPPTSAVSSSAPPSQKTVTKPTAVANIAAAPKKQQQIATTAGVTMAPVSNPSNRSLSLSSPSAIAPQVKVVNQQQPPPILGINSTAGQNYTFASSSPVVASDKLMYIGYQGSSSTGDSSSSKDKSSSDTKASHGDSSSSKDKSSSDTKASHGDSSSSKDKSSSHIKSSIHNDDGSKSLSSKISSIISDSFNFKHSRYSDSNDDSEESVFGDNFFGGDSFFSSDPTAEASSSSSAAAGDSGGASVASASSSTVGSGSAASSSSTASS